MYRIKHMPAKCSESVLCDCVSSLHSVSSLCLPCTLCCQKDAWWQAGSEQSTHICTRAPLIPIIHKFSRRDLYPPPALQCLLSLSLTSLWLLGRNEMSQKIRTWTCSHVAAHNGDDSCWSPLVICSGISGISSHFFISPFYVSPWFVCSFIFKKPCSLKRHL